MSKPTKLQVARYHRIRLRAMLRDAEDRVEALEAKEAGDPITVSQARLLDLQARVDAANNCQLVKEMGRVNTYNPFADIENTDHLLALLQKRLRQSGGL